MVTKPSIRKRVCMFCRVAHGMENPCVDQDDVTTQADLTANDWAIQKLSATADGGK